MMFEQPFTRRPARPAAAVAPALTLVVLLAGGLLPGSEPAARAAAGKQRVLLVDTSSPRVPAALRRLVLVSLDTGLAKQGLDVRQLEDPVRAVGKRIEAMLSDARELTRRFEEAAALELLERAESTFRDAAAHLRQVEPLIEILLTRAQIATDAGQKKVATEALSRVAVLDPERTLDPGRFVPQLVRVLGNLRTRVARQTGQVRVSATPSGLPVWIDGERRQAVAPAEITLVAGEHLVAVGPADRTAARLVTVPAGGSVEIELSLTTPDDNRLRADGKAASAEWVVAARVGREGHGYRVSLRVLPVATVAVARQLRSEPFDADRATWAVSKLLIDVLPLARPQPAAAEREGPLPGDSERGAAIWRRWWFWTAVGAVVAAGGGATAAVLLTRERGVRVQLVP